MQFAAFLPVNVYAVPAVPVIDPAIPTVAPDGVET
jgi:hypothetical protein